MTIINNKLKGSLLVAVSALFYASYGLWSKLMAGHFGEFNQAWSRALILLVVLIPYGLLTKNFKKIQRKDLKWFLVVSFSGGLNQAPYFFGFENLTIGTATLLFYLALVLGAYLIGKFFFREKFTKVKYFSLFISLIGLFIIYKFALNAGQIPAAVLTMTAGFMGASVVVFSKKISGNYSELQIICGFLIVMLFANFPLSLIFNESLPRLSFTQPWLAQTGYLLTMLLANIAAVSGFKYLEPSIGGLIGLLEIFFSKIQTLALAKILFPFFPILTARFNIENMLQITPP